MDKDKMFKMTGKTSEQIDRAIALMEQRTKRTKEHQRLTREIFDVQWPCAVNTGKKEDWDRVCIAIDGVIEYLQANSDFFPNYKKHMAQWGTLKKVADCVCCAHEKPCNNSCININLNDVNVNDVKKDLERVA